MDSYVAVAAECRAFSVHSDLGNRAEMTNPLETPIGTEVDNYLLESVAQDNWFSSRCNHRLSATKSEHELRRDLVHECRPEWSTILD